MTTQQQDLVFYNDHSIISEKVLEPSSHALHIITHSEGTEPNWLINTIVETCLVGTANSVNRDLSRTAKSRASVTYVSFFKSRDSVYKSCRRQGLDLDTANDFFFIDCFTGLFSNSLVHPNNSRPEVESLFAKISDRVRSGSHRSKVVIIHSPELLLAATTISSNELIRQIQKLNQVCNAVIIVADTSDALIDMDALVAESPVFRITDFYVKLHHKSSLNVNLSPLATGKAKDLTGSLTVARGAIPLHKDVSISDREYVFHLSKENSVKIYFR